MKKITKQILLCTDVYISAYKYDWANISIELAELAAQICPSTINSLIPSSFDLDKKYYEDLKEEDMEKEVAKVAKLLNPRRFQSSYLICPVRRIKEN